MGRLVKRYGNRKLYDTSESRYVTLDEIGRWVKAGEDVKILENDTGEDLTAVTFAQIILEEERRKSGLLSLRVLREIIQHGETALQGIAATVDRGMEVIRSAPERSVRELTQVAERLGQLQRLVDETVRRSVERVTTHPAFQKEMRRIERSIRALEARITRLRPRNDGSGNSPPPEGPGSTT
jgi:polyhydroxyalkanoate synthesis repressor PhaR